MALTPQDILATTRQTLATGNPVSAFFQGAGAAGDLQQQALESQRLQQQIAQSATMAPLQQQIAEQQVQAGQAEQAAIERNRVINGFARAAQVIKPFVEKGDLVGAAGQLEGVSAFLPPEAVQDIEQALSVGNIDELKDQISAIEQIQASINVDQTLEERKLTLRREEMEQRRQLIEGEAERAGQKAEAKAVGKAKGEAEVVDLIADTKSKIQSAVKLAESDAKEKGEVLTDIARAEATLPSLYEVVGNLKNLAAVATYTTGGKVYDAAVKQLGFGATEGATARAKFIATIDNQILPLLKPTFGAAFTVQEGESLKATLGDPDSTPEEKVAQLTAFIEAKERDLSAKQRQAGGASAPTRIRFDAQGNIVQ